MPEYRHNLISDRWVIIASERTRRPQDFTHTSTSEPVDFIPDCPFCPGNEKLTPPETYALRPDNSAPDTPGWAVRVIPNKYPFLDFNQNESDLDSHILCQPAAGQHEVLIDSPHHSRHFAHHDFEHICNVILSLRHRYRTFCGHEEIKHICIFKNHGPSSGASLFHPHFQIAAAVKEPPRLNEQIKYCQNYYQTHHKSVFDFTIEKELEADRRVIAYNDNFVALCPSAPMCPFEAYILPRIPQPHFGSIGEEMIPGLAEMFQILLTRLDTGLNRPDFNIAFHTPPVSYPDDQKAFRWYIQLYPRLVTHGGFELVTDTYVNTVTPESAAQFYRNQNST